MHREYETYAIVSFRRNSEICRKRAEHAMHAFVPESARNCLLFRLVKPNESAFPALACKKRAFLARPESCD